jgi:putative chitinase
MKTQDLLIKMGATSANATKFAGALEAAMQEFSINTPKRVAMFIAQLMHESGKLAFVAENLNYKAESLNAVFPKYFKNAGRDATQYARQPEKIANVVYASRMGNGDTASGEGWKFRGRGLIQLTGKENYTKCGAALGKDLIADPSYLESPEGAARSAAWFWNKNGLNTLADAGDIVTCTKRINGGTIGLEDRKKHYNEALHLID